MKKYIKDNVIKPADRIVIIKDGMQIINPTHEQILTDGWQVYVEPIYEPTLEDIKRQKVAEITDYDTSNSVNSFTLDGEQVWLDKDTRVGLMNSTSIQKTVGKETTTLWFEGKSYTLPCDTAIQMLSALELYALECYNVTAQHKANVEALQTKEEVESYDYTINYPEKLNLKTT